MIRTLTENIYEPLRESNVSNGTIRNVCLLRPISKNNRFYTTGALKDLQRLSQGAKCFLDHEMQSPSPSVLKLVGSLENPQLRNGAVYGDLKILKESPYSELCQDIARTAPNLVGFSICAEGKIADKRDAQGREVVQGILELRSIDIVSFPATVAGMFEQESKPELPDITKEEFIYFLKNKRRFLCN